MRVSVVVRSRDEGPRLRLTLASLARQTLAPEVIVVDDGSSDHTQDVIAEAQQDMPVRALRHASPRGRAGASNAGARVATGDVLVFLDGDTLADPELVERHADAQRSQRRFVGRGERFHFRGTRFFADPERGTPRAGEEARVQAMSAAERARLSIRRDDIVHDFAALARRADPGVYPGAGPRRLQEIEIDALRHQPGCSALWAAACGSNLSVARDDFLRAGGFNEAIDINEHRELALRLCDDGARIGLVEGARDYHMTHRVGWRDPLADSRWERAFYAAHPRQIVKLLAVFWASLAPACPIPPEARITSLVELEAAARGDNGIDYDAVRRLIGTLPDLPPARERLPQRVAVHSVLRT
jgi:glycosyltransferase involved in cell wall biosynthesis